MLPLILVLVAAQSAFAAPSVSVSLYSANEISPTRDNGRPVSSYLTDRLFDLIDGGDTNIYILTLQQVLNDLANQGDSLSQAMALAQTIATVGELSTGVPGDQCEASALVDAYAGYLSNGNSAGVRRALGAYVGRIIANIDLITKLSNNPESVRYSTGSRGNCAGGGRYYNIEAIWDSILANAGPNQIGLFNEEYCAAKRLYSAFNVRSNNVGAAVTAAALSPVTQIYQQSLQPVVNFLRAVASGGNVAGAAAAAKSAISQSAGRVQL